MKTTKTALFTLLAAPILCAATTAKKTVITAWLDTGGGHVIRPLVDKGVTWDCTHMTPTPCYYLESVLGSGLYDVPSEEFGPAFAAE